MATTNNSQRQNGRKTTGKTASNGNGGARKAATKARSSAQRSTAKKTSAAAKKTSGGAKKTSAAASRSSRGSTPARRSSRTSRSSASSTNGATSNGSLRSKLVPSAVGAVVGGAAVGAARLASRHSRPKVLGVRVPDQLNPRHIGKDLDIEAVIRHIGNFAEQLEARSEEVRALSAQAKRLSRRIG